ncbi:MAG TPA: malonic semialdehyde reductase [Gammaproteobacteria bacterium]|nr:malonic semialdehyde reductase [Gammaproteobacteria bacterium]
MTTSLGDAALDTLFREARSHNGWRDEAVTDAQLHALYDLMKMGPTAANACPARLVFVRGEQAKKRLEPCLDPANVEKCNSAPVVALIAMDLAFHEQLPKLFPHTDARSWYEGKPEKIREAAFRNSTLQGAYFIIAARSIGLDCGPMSGFDADQLNAEFFPDGRVVINFICALGHGDPDKLFERLPRLDFDEACSIL